MKLKQKLNTTFAVEQYGTIFNSVCECNGKKASLESTSPGRQFPTNPLCKGFSWISFVPRGKTWTMHLIDWMQCCLHLIWDESVYLRWWKWNRNWISLNLDAIIVFLVYWFYKCMLKSHFSWNLTCSRWRCLWKIK